MKLLNFIKKPSILIKRMNIIITLGIAIALMKTLKKLWIHSI